MGKGGTGKGKLNSIDPAKYQAIQDRMRREMFEEVQRDLQGTDGSEHPDGVNLMIVLDVSGSMAELSNGDFRIFLGTMWNLVKAPVMIFSGQFDQMVEDWSALWQSKLSECQRTVCDQLRANREKINTVGLIAFNHEIVEHIDFTRNIDTVATKAKELKPSGNTALYDSVAQAYKLISAAEKAGEAKGVWKAFQLLVLTDGCDNMSSDDNRQYVEAISSHRPKGESAECQAFFIGLCDGDNEVNRALAGSMVAEYEGVSAAGFLEKSAGSEAINNAFQSMGKRRKSHHQRQRCQKFKDRVQIPTPGNSD